MTNDNLPTKTVFHGLVSGMFLSSNGYPIKKVNIKILHTSVKKMVNNFRREIQITRHLPVTYIVFLVKPAQSDFLLFFAFRFVS